MTPKLQTRALGSGGPQVTALGMILPLFYVSLRAKVLTSLAGWGSMGLSIFYGTKLPDEERLKFLDYICDSGMTFWDSSDIYGDSEDLLGQYETLYRKSLDISYGR